MTIRDYQGNQTIQDQLLNDICITCISSPILSITIYSNVARTLGTPYIMFCWFSAFTRIIRGSRAPKSVNDRELTVYNFTGLDC